MPGGQRFEALFAAYPQGAALALHQLGQGGNGALAQVGSGSRQGAGKRQPLFAVIVVVAVEMLADEHFQPGAEGPRKQHARQQEGGAKQEGQLHQAAPGAAHETQVVGGHAHRQQVDCRAQQRRRMEGHAARDGQLGRPGGAPQQGNRQQRYDQRIDQAARRPQLGIEFAQQQHIAVQVEIVGKQRTQAEADEFHGPPHLHAAVAVELLHQQHAQHRHAKAADGQHVEAQAGRQLLRQQAGQQHGAIHGEAGLEGARTALPQAQHGQQHGRPGRIAQPFGAVQHPRRPRHHGGAGHHRTPQHGQQRGRGQHALVRSLVRALAPAGQDQHAK